MLPAEPLRKGFPNREVLTIFLVAKAVIVAALLLAFYGYDEMHDVNLWQPLAFGNGRARRPLSALRQLGQPTLCVAR